MTYRWNGRSLFFAFILATLAALIAGQTARAQEEVDTGDDEEQEVIDRTFSMPEDVAVRARVSKSDSKNPIIIRWRYGGEGLGGDVTGGQFLAKPPPKALPSLDDPAVPQEIKGFEDPGDLGDKLGIGQWSQWMPINTFGGGGRRGFPSQRVLTVTAVSPESKKAVDPLHRAPALYNEFEFQISWKGRILKTVTEVAPQGATAGLVIRASPLVAGVTPEDKAFLDNGFMGLKEYVERRTAAVESFPWNANAPRPQLFVVVSDLGGLGVGSGYGIRHTNPQISEAELRTMRALGFNSLRALPAFVYKSIDDPKSQSRYFTRGRIGGAPGYMAGSYDPEISSNAPDAGCPFKVDLPKIVDAAVAESIERNKKTPVREIWALTDDEIGSAFSKTKENNNHILVCPRCMEAYREYLKSHHVEPEQVGFNSWDQVKPEDTSPQGLDKPWLTNPANGLNAYYSRMFINFGSAQMFTRTRAGFAEWNKKVESAPAGSPESKLPVIYSYALRGNTFLMSGASLDFFDFYRYADNGFVHETSNRDPRVWNWDGYLLDVGRMMVDEQGMKLGLYVKPHRGAPIQRTLAAVSRGAQMIYHYTYGPDYYKGDGYSGSVDTLKLVSKSSAMIARVEPHVYKRPLTEKARIGLVQPRSSEIWRRLGAGEAWPPAYENCKWVYTALRNAKLPIDPLDEVMLERNDLSRYDIIYYMGPNITRKAIVKLRKFVEDGGTLYTSGYGLVCDEANIPRKELLDMLGLTERPAPQMWRRVGLYGATGYSNYLGDTSIINKPAEGTNGPITGTGIFKGASVVPTVAREVLSPAPGTQVVATYSDGKPAATVRTLGKGKVITVGFYSGLDYFAPNLVGDLDMEKAYKPEALAFIAAPALEKITPRTAVNRSNVETVLLDGQGSAKSLILMNWAYRHTGVLIKTNRGTRPVRAIDKATDLQITVRDMPSVKKVYSAGMDQQIKFKQEGNDIVITLPTLEEGDILLIE